MSCVFCAIAAQSEPIAGIVIFKPLNPVTPGHMLLIHAKHTSSAAIDPIITGEIFEQAAYYGKRRGVPFNLITSVGTEATQSVLHTHIHYVPRFENDGLKLPWTDQIKEEL